MVLVVLQKICDDRQMLLDLYANYDCDEYMTNIFERMIHSLVRIVQNREPAPAEIKLKALECLGSVMTSLGEWCRPLEAEDTPENDAADEQALCEFVYCIYCVIALAS